MPRTNRERTPLAEQHLARRIAAERQRRDWTYERLSERMADAKCSIHPSAIFKIEKGNPPRRITVDELVGFAAAFDVSVTYLLGSQADGWQPDMAHLTAELERLFNEHQAIERARNEKLAQLQSLVMPDQISHDAFREWIDTDFSNWPEFLHWAGIQPLIRSTRLRSSRKATTP